MGPVQSLLGRGLMWSYDVVTNAQEHLDFDTVRKIGLALPGVKECTTWALPHSGPGKTSGLRKQKRLTLSVAEAIGFPSANPAR